MKPQQKTRTTTWLPVVLMVMLFGLTAAPASAVPGGYSQSLPDSKDLLQFKAGSHIIGFKPDKVYLANTAGFLSVEFLGARKISPLATPPSINHSKDDPISALDNNKAAILHRVDYPSLWDGITLRYEAVKNGIAESTYFIEPGAKVADIRLRYNADTELQQDGSLKINLPTGQGYITESRPVAWQILDGRKKEVQVAYEIKDGAIGFKTGAYNKDRELIIDPTYQWHTFYGSATDDHGSGVAVDGKGNVYVTGDSQGSWLGPNNTAPKHAYQGGSDIVVLKLNSSGTYQWHTFYGSTSTDYGGGIAVDDNGCIYVTGTSYQAWMGPGNTAPIHAYTGGFDITTFKLDSSGTYQWHTFHGSSDEDHGMAIAVDGSGNSYITGRSYATWLVLVNGMTYRLPVHAHSGGSDIVSVKLNSSGLSVWHTFYGSGGVDEGNSIAIDQSGNVFIAGVSNGAWLGPNCEYPKYAYHGGMDIIGLKLVGLSGAYNGHSFFGSTMNDHGRAVALDQSGNIYITGYSEATWGNPVNSFTPGGSEIVVFGLDSTGTIMWNTFHGSASVDYSYGIAVDKNGNIYTVGQSWASWGSPENPHNDSWDVVTCKINQSGKLLWHTFHGSATDDYGTGIAVDGNKNIYVTGSGWANWGIPLHEYTSNLDIFVMKFRQFPWPMFLPAITNAD